MIVPTATTISSAQQTAVPSLWTALELLESTTVVSMTLSITRTRGADFTRSPRLQCMAEMVALTATTTSNAPTVGAPNLWIVLESLDRTARASMMMIIRTRGAGCTRLQEVLLTMVTLAHTQTTSTNAPRLGALSQWTVLALGILMVLATMTKRITRMSAAASTK